MPTGGIPAEYLGTPGLLSNVITKSGTNAFKGAPELLDEPCELWI